MKVLSSNDSARSFLPVELIFNESNSSELADKIMAVKNVMNGEDSEAIKKAADDLGQTIQKIGAAMYQNQKSDVGSRKSEDSEQKNEKKEESQEEKKPGENQTEGK